MNEYKRKKRLEYQRRWMRVSEMLKRINKMKTSSAYTIDKLKSSYRTHSNSESRTLNEELPDNETWHNWKRAKRYRKDAEETSDVGSETDSDGTVAQRRKSRKLVKRCDTVDKWKWVRRRHREAEDSSDVGSDTDTEASVMQRQQSRKLVIGSDTDEESSCGVEKCSIGYCGSEPRRGAATSPQHPTPEPLNPNETQQTGSLELHLHKQVTSSTLPLGPSTTRAVTADVQPQSRPSLYQPQAETIDDIVKYIEATNPSPQSCSQTLRTDCASSSFNMGNLERQANPSLKRTPLAPRSLQLDENTPAVKVNVNLHSEIQNLNLKMDLILNQLKNQSLDILNLQNIVERLNMNSKFKKKEDTLLIQDFLPQPLSTPLELENFCSKLRSDNAFRKSLVDVLSMLGGQNMKDYVRRIMQRLGTYPLWSQYSLKGRKRKRVFQDLELFHVIIKVCLNSFSDCTERDVQFQISEILKSAPNKPGGNRYKGAPLPNWSYGQARASFAQAGTSYGQVKTSDGQVKTSDGQAKTSDGQVKTSDGQAKTLYSLAKASDGQAKTSDGQAKTLYSLAKASDGQAKTLDGQTKTSDGQVKTSDGQTKTSDGQTKTSDGQAGTSDGQAKSSNAQAKTSFGQMRMLNAQPRIPDSQTRMLNAQPRIPDSQTRMLNAQPRTPDSQTRMLNAQPKTPDGQAKLSFDLTRTQIRTSDDNTRTSYGQARPKRRVLRSEHQMVKIE
ncbi:uncharacterized protein [Procambarus clarkii]|uniref:uncharacterized protein n=1 Tax=Procambarus clarkii TaxID=6728 RepID=UPI003743306B